MKNKILSLISLLLATACSSVKVIDIEPTPGFALANYKTFDFFKTESSGDISPKFDERLVLLKAEISKQLVARGLSQATDGADLLINIGIVVEEKIQTRESDIRTDGARYMGQRNYTWKSEEIEVGRYREGTVTLHLVDRSKNAMVWRGAMNGIIPEKDSNVKETIAAGIEELIKKVN